MSTFLVAAALVLYMPRHGILARRAAAGGGGLAGTPAPEGGVGAGSSDNAHSAGMVDALTGQPREGEGTLAAI